MVSPRVFVHVAHAAFDNVEMLLATTKIVSNVNYSKCKSDCSEYEAVVVVVIVEPSSSM